MIRDVNNPTLERTNDGFFIRFPAKGIIDEIRVYQDDISNKQLISWLQRFDMFFLTKMARESYLILVKDPFFFCIFRDSSILKWVSFERKYSYIWEKNSYNRYAIWSWKIKPAMILTVSFIAHVATWLVFFWKERVKVQVEYLWLIRIKYLRLMI